MDALRIKFSEIKPLVLWASVLILVDQLTKAWVRYVLPVGQVYRPELALSQYIRLVHLKNYGALGGFLANSGWLIALLTGLICVAILFIYARISPANRAARLGMVLLFAGGLGNLLDRLLFGSVTDFISILSLPAMNFADLYVLIGLVTLVLSIDEGGKPKDKIKSVKQSANPSQPSEEAHR